MSLAKLTGWMPGSIGFHTDDGLLYNGSGSGKAYHGKSLARGEWLGMMIDPLGSTMFFTINGQVLPSIEMPNFNDVYLSLGFKGEGIKVEMNSGPHFQFDYPGYKSEMAKHLSTNIRREPVPDEFDIVTSLLIPYLSTNGYTDTANALLESTQNFEAIQEVRELVACRQYEEITHQGFEVAKH
jgi:hypothetical protein